MRGEEERAGLKGVSDGSGRVGMDGLSDEACAMSLVESCGEGASED